MYRGAVQDTIEAWLVANKYEIGCFGVCDHKFGLPPGVLVRPDHTLVDGAMTYLVTATEVHRCICLSQCHQHEWEIKDSKYYSSRQELKSILDPVLKEDWGCWQP